ncbi:hypothetical protein K491DRAFT_596820 [Lophiostoma macrostomum CBS 122681]|uniref:Pentatricopeptide repeat domain-containing protein n=1 Tax=Lophiostoma macrostomum CBS 122681 TaxID=1314788 RepID=A0A6A6TBC2_9PLEO|nr:hypothetical protein K491DRAFT_596820 [Lophiostoma macrostomum CBS 122681]
MLTLWSRAWRTPRTCRCYQCVTNTSAIARRTWPFGTPTSTFTYTAIFAAGLALDGRAKLQRNRQWDDAFADLQKDPTEPFSMDARLEQQSVRICESNCATLADLSGSGIEWNVMGRIAGTELDQDVLYEEGLSKRNVESIPQGLWRLLEVDSRFPGFQAMGWPVNTGPDLDRKNLAPQSLWSYDAVREKALRRRHTWKKLSIQELSIALLAIRLLRDARKLQLSTEYLDSLSSTIRDLVMSEDARLYHISAELHRGLRDIERLTDFGAKAEIDEAKALLAHLPTPQYVQDNDGDFYHICQQMNENIKRIFGDDDTPPRHGPFLAQSLAKIAHNLLISTAGPDVQTFNLLITGFKRWQLAGIVDRTILALDSCKIRPNELTCCAILEYYTEMNQPERFSNFIERMRGTKNALMLAHPDLHINEAGEARLIRINEKKVFQKVHPTPMVFNTLMRGLMRFTSLQRSLEIYYELKDDGWGLDISTLNHFLIECTRDSDWTSGCYVWNEICSIKGKLKRQDMREAYSNMLSLCSVTHNINAFNHVLGEAVRGRFDSKGILKAARSIAEKAQVKHVRSVLPFTADDLIIAVSDYMGSEKLPHTDIDRDEDENGFDAPAVPTSIPSNVAIAEEPDRLADPWDAWLDHELEKKK